MLAVGEARAEFPRITSRDYAIDLYDGVALGDLAMTGMGGAGAAHVIGTAGVLLNPSAIAVRPTTDNDPWSLDYHLDFLTATFSTDYDNNGEVSSGGASLLTGGLGGRYHDWAFAATATAQTTPIGDDSGDLRAQTLRARLVLAKWLPSYDLAIGGGVQTAQFRIESGNSDDPLFSIAGATVTAGATWKPRDQRFRIAASFDGPIDGGEVDAESCDPENCNGYILPDHVRSPWRVVAGGAYRVAPTAWNQQVLGPWRDEQALTLALDVVMSGATSNGFGLEAFGRQELQRSGRHSAFSVRGGANFEWLPGRLRVRAGSYWEPARFEDTTGRLHGTFGIDVRVLAFHLWGPRRGRLSLTGDMASRYRNVGVSIGLWH